MVTTAHSTPSWSYRQTVRDLICIHQLTFKVFIYIGPLMACLVEYHTHTHTHARTHAHTYTHTHNPPGISVTQCARSSLSWNRRGSTTQQRCSLGGVNAHRSVVRAQGRAWVFRPLRQALLSELDLQHLKSRPTLSGTLEQRRSVGYPMSALSFIPAVCLTFVMSNLFFNSRGVFDM
jgi:hypothetical protein